MPPPTNRVEPAPAKELYPILCFLFLSYNTATAAFRSIHDPWALAFVLGAYADLLCLFWCLRRFETSSDDSSSSKAKLKVAVWLLATLLTAMFSYKVAVIMPLPVAVLIWCMASATTVGGFYAFFVYREPSLLDKPADAANLIKEINEEEEVKKKKKSMVIFTSAAF